ncbi:hypothetical protein [Catellatospora tritici]|uniref:hypothetical protein n=1 Tax=Catellatospora tritici TaxID=2851566 RepID=UPI001C2CD721|nr:hypothetical protein [Catellatospora tritici]MBV1854473.1 hypothetical protein [Catellatospora tritici]
MSAPSPIETPARRKIKWSLIGAFVVGTVTVVGTLAQTWSIFFPNSAAPADPTRPAGPAGVTATAGPAPASAAAVSATSAAPTSGVYLSDLTPALGKGRLISLPDGLPPMSHAIATRCPANTTMDNKVEISYERPRTAKRLTATLRAFQDPTPVNQLVQLMVFPDPQDRKPGSADEGPSSTVQATIDSPATVSAKVDDAYYVRLLIQCNKPGTIVVLADALLTP